MQAIRIGKSRDGRIRIDTDENGAFPTMLFEPIKGGGYVRSIFSGDGGVILQTIIKANANDINDYITRLEGNIMQCNYEEVHLHKPCPECGNRSLRRQHETAAQVSEVTVIPIYICQKCQTRSYYLTKEYISYLRVFAPYEIIGLHHQKV